MTLILKNNKDWMTNKKTITQSENAWWCSCCQNCYHCSVQFFMLMHQNIWWIVIVIFLTLSCLSDVQPAAGFCSIQRWLKNSDWCCAIRTTGCWFTKKWTDTKLLVHTNTGIASFWSWFSTTTLAAAGILWEKTNDSNGDSQG